MLVKNIQIKVKKDEVLRQIDCLQDNPVYKEIENEYREIEGLIYSLCEPVVVMEPGYHEGKQVIMVICSLGEKVSQYSTHCFQEGEYVKGMLADAMADSALFSMEHEMVTYLEEMCKSLQMGIQGRLEAPQDFPMHVQKQILEKTKAKELCGITISDGFMFCPVKTNAMMFLLTEEKEFFFYQHNCHKCTKKDCKMRCIPEIPVMIYEQETKYKISVKKGESLLESLMRTDSSFSAVCGGKGKCGKCKIKLLNGRLSVTESDAAYFSGEELKKGYRLACKAYPKEAITVQLCFSNEASISAVSEYDTESVVETKKCNNPENESYGIAVDIGTTTIAMQLISLDTGAVLHTHAFLNGQRRYGADVISRIQASTQGKGDELQFIIRNLLIEGVRKLIDETKVQQERIKKIAIAGNTTMIHLLMNYDCKGLGVFPFIPVNIQGIKSSYEKMFEDDFLDADVHIIPGISTFVGGDIVSGLYAQNFDEKEEYNFFIDFGTNGEMALGNKNRILVTSTAAGPAFEGGNISHGVGSIEGAISSAQIVGDEVRIKTIGDKKPVGICGTGVVETVAELVREEWVDETGYLDEIYFDMGFPLCKKEDGTDIVFTQQDIREFQLAKSAVRAGIETLLLRFNIHKNQISTVYLAGGFGFRLDEKKAIFIGLLPKEFAGKIKVIGNSSLNGAVKSLLQKGAEEKLSSVVKQAQEINLSSDKIFNQLYMEHMYFE